MKKGLILFAALFLLVGTSAFAKVTAVKEGDVVKVTWTYEGADAGSVGLVGDFNGWNLAGALPMTKGANGVWSITLDGKTTSEYKYKFNVDGEWTEDPTAPAGVDDGFGGTNGYVVAADLLGGASGAPAGPKGFVPAFFMSSWAAAHFITQSVDSPNDRGLELSDVSLNAKAYLGWDGYMFPELLKVTGEIRLFRADEDLADKSVYLYRRVQTGSGAVTTVEYWDGLKNLAAFPWTAITNFNKEDGSNGNWPSIKGKLKLNLELKDLNAKIAHSIGWMKPSKIKLDQGLVRYFGDPDANLGITEVFNATPLNLIGGKLNYLAQFDISSAALANRFSADFILGDLTLGGFSTLEYGTKDPYKIFGEHSKLDSRNFLTGTFKTSGITVTGQVGARLKNGQKTGKEIEEPYFGGLKVGYEMKDLFEVSSLTTYAGDIGINAAGLGGDGLGKVLYNTTGGTFYAGKISAFIENNYQADYMSLSTTADSLKLGASYKDGIEITPTVKMTLPLVTNADAKFILQYVNVTVKQGPLDAEVRWTSNDAAFTINKYVALANYALSDKMNAGLALAYQYDVDGSNNPFGFTATFDTKTGWEAVKDPTFFAVAGYNIDKALDSPDGTVFKKDGDGARDISAVNLGKGAVLRTGLRWAF